MAPVSSQVGIAGCAQGDYAAALGFACSPERQPHEITLGRLRSMQSCMCLHHAALCQPWVSGNNKFAASAAQRVCNPVQVTNVDEWKQVQQAVMDLQMKSRAGII